MRNQEYPLDFGGQTVGKVQVREEGLYRVFHCRCKFPGEIISKAVLWVGDCLIHLGVLAPVGDGFGLDTRIPRKRIPEGEWRFEVVPGRGVLAGRYIPIKPEEPFAYLARLKDAYLSRMGDQVYAVIPSEG